MRFPLTAVPLDPAGVPRPLLSLDIEGIEEPVTFLIDTGAIHNRLPSEWAIDAGIDLGGRETEMVALPGQPSVVCYIVEDVQATFGDVALTVAVRFCDDWNAPFGLLGQEGFLQYFIFTLSVGDQWFDLDEV